jgi:hypothetical protein
MHVQRQVRTVNGEIVLEKQLEQFVFLYRPRMALPPEQTVMNDQQIGSDFDGHFDCRQTRIDGGGNARHLAVVLHLKSVGRTGVVRDVLRLEQPVTILHKHF